MKETKSDTPRTDAAFAAYVPADFARKLERELAQAEMRYGCVSELVDDLELVEALKDVKRMNWLEEQGFRFMRHHWLSDRAENIRKAIDAAMSQPRPHPK